MIMNIEKKYEENKIDVIFLQLFKKDLIWKEHFLKQLKIITNNSRTKINSLIETHFKK